LVEVEEGWFFLLLVWLVVGEELFYLLLAWEVEVVE
jgi:hypothetical protein